MSTQHEVTKRPLPAGWRWVKLGEVCRQDHTIVEPGSSLAEKLPYLSLEHIESNTGRILKNPTERIEDEGKSTTFYFDERHVLYGKLRPYLNKVALPDFAGRCTTEMIPLLPGKDIDREFLGWVLRRRETVDVAMRCKTGSRMPRVDMDKLLNLDIPLPPLSEQRRIVAVLREQMAAVERARRAAEEQLKAVKALPAALLRRVFPRSGQPLPAGWQWVKLGEMCQLIVGRTPSRSIPEYWRGGLPWVTIADLNDGVITNTKETISQLGVSASRSCRLRLGTILFSFKLTIGKMGIAGVDLYTNEAIVGIVPKEPARLNNDYLWFALKSINPVVDSSHAVKGKTLNQQTLHTLLIPLPPLSEQKRIAAVLREQIVAVEQARRAVEEQLEAINQLPAAVLRKAFNGGL